MPAFLAPLIGGLVSSIPSIFQTFEGIRQRDEAQKGLANLKRPEYQTPEEAQRALGMSQRRAADPFMPGQGAYMDRLEQQAANAFQQSTEAGNPFALISNIQGQAAQQLRDVNTQAMQQRMQNEQQYQNALMQMSTFRDREWQLNKFAPYKDQYNELRDMFGAGSKNLYGGISGLSSIGTSLAGNLLGNIGGPKTSYDPEGMQRAYETFYGLNSKQTGGGTTTNQYGFNTDFNPTFTYQDRLG